MWVVSVVVAAGPPNSGWGTGHLIGGASGAVWTLVERSRGWDFKGFYFKEFLVSFYIFSYV